MAKVLFEKITPEQLLTAAKYIDEHRVPVDRVSREYDAWVEKKPYPPPYLLAVINAELGGELIKLSDLGNNTDKAFSILRNAGANVFPKWVALFNEIGKKLSTYNYGNSGELVDILKQVGIQVGLDDKDELGNKIPLEEIDPFSFLCVFTKYGEKQRAEFLSNLKSVWALKSTVPNDYPGVPSANAQKTWLFSYLDTRDKEDIPLLWELFHQVFSGNIKAETFNSALNVHNTGQAKLTEVLFDYDPFTYLPINQQTIPYLNEKGIDTKFNDFNGYKAVLKRIKSVFTDSFPKISADAVIFNQKRSCSYFIFKSNPKQWDLIKHLKEGTVGDWAVTKLHNLISIGDKVIIYKTGEKEGVYALAEISTEIQKRDMRKEAESGEWKDNSFEKFEDKVGVEIIHNLVDNPVLLPVLEKSGLFKRPPQGTNFKADKDQFDFLLKSINNIQAEKPRERGYYKNAPGRNAVYWSDFQSQGIIALGWDDIGDYNHYPDIDAISNALGVGSQSNEAWNIDLFANEAQEGDIVFATQGVNVVLDIGIIDGPCIYQEDKPLNKNTRKVKWLGLKSFDLEPYAQEIGYKCIFRRDTFTPVKPFKFIFSKYVQVYPEVAKLFDKHDLSYELEVIPESITKYKNPNIILFGPPGTGKTYSTIDLAVEIATGQNEGHSKNKIVFDELRTEGQIEFITFHQNYSYEDFVVGLRPDADHEELRFIPHKGIFYEMCRRARENYDSGIKGEGKKRSFDDVFQEIISPLDDGKEVPIKMKSGPDYWITEVNERTIYLRKPDGKTERTLNISSLKGMVEGTQEKLKALVPYNTPLIELINEKRETKEKAEPIRNFVLIIDEINRGNIARIFGELITLLEDDKRLGQENELKVTLTNGEKGFSVPPNLFLIGTMNTADKSIALLDIALRRRFEFIGKYPVYDDLSPLVQDKLLKLNEAIVESKKSPDYMIGHAYFINKSDDDFADIMNKKIIPLLYEYFNGRDEFVKKILDNAEIEVKRNKISLTWEAQKL